MATVAQVTQAYFDVLGRPPDPAGLAYYTSGEGAAKGIDQIRADFQYATDIGAESPALVNQADVDQFNNLVATGNYTQAADFAASKGVDPAVTADYIGQNAANLGLPSDFRMNAADVSSLTGQNVSSVNTSGTASPAENNALELLNRTYQTTLNRAPDQAGIDFYLPKIITGELNENNLIPTVVAGATSGEDKVAATNYSTALLDRVYNDVFGRAPDQAGIDFYLPKILSGTLNESSLIPAVTGGAASGLDQQAAIDFALQTNLGEFDRLVASGDFTGAKSVLDQSINQYYLDPTASYANIAEYLNKDPKFADIRAENKGASFDVENIRNFGEKKINAGMDDYVRSDRPYVQAPVLDKDGNVVSAPSDRAPGGVYQPTYTPYRQQAQVTQAYRDILGRSPDPTGLAYYTTGEGAARGIDQIRRDFQYAVDTGAETPVVGNLGDGPFGGYYAQPGVSPYGGVFGVGTEQFEQQSDPFSGAQARARSLISNRLTPLTDNIPIDSRQPAPFGGDVAANGVTPSPFAYRQTLSPTTLAALAAEATPGAAASEVSGRRGGYVDQGIAAVRR